MADNKENYLWDLGSKRVKEDINKWIPVIFYPAPNTQFFFEGPFLKQSNFNFS